MAKSKNKISVRLTTELLDKMNLWKRHGYHSSDIVRRALALLPSSPQVPQVQFSKVKPLRNQSPQVELKDEILALKTLQEW